MLPHRSMKVNILKFRRAAKNKFASFQLSCIFVLLLTACTDKQATQITLATAPQFPSPSIPIPTPVETGTATPGPSATVTPNPLATNDFDYHPTEYYPGLPVIPAPPLTISPAEVQPPLFPLSDYALHTPSEQELNQQIYMQLADDLYDYRYFDSPYSSFRQSLRQEFLLRFQNSNDLDKIRWSYVLQAPRDPLSSPGLTTQDVFASLLEEELDTGQTSIETLPTWLYDRGLEAVVFAPVPNLFGKKKNGYAFQVMIDSNSEE